MCSTVGVAQIFSDSPPCECNQSARNLPAASAPFWFSSAMFSCRGGTQLSAMALPGAGQNRDDGQIELSMKQSIARRQNPDIYHLRLQTIMKIAGGQKDHESRWWELRSVMDDYEWQDTQELPAESALENQLQTTPSEHSTTTGGMTGDSSSSSPKLNEAKRRLSSQQEQMIAKNREAAALKNKKGNRYGCRMTGLRRQNFSIGTCMC
jgi:hypothetical protein